MYIPQDKFAKRARAEGFRARSAYKLLDLQKKYHLIKKGDTVLDLGSYPGGWLQVISEIIGEKGKAVGVDLRAAKSIASNIKILQKDIFDENTTELILKISWQKFDVVLSDMAPSTSGVKGRDQMKSYELSARAFEIAHNVLVKGGGAAVKTFEGPETPNLLKDMRHYFYKVNIIKPVASRKGSKECYIIARGFKEKL